MVTNSSIIPAASWGQPIPGLITCSLVSLHQARRAPSTGNKAPTYGHVQTQKGTNRQTRAKAERHLHADTRKGRLPLWARTTSSRGCRPPLSTNSIRRLLWFSIQSKALQKPSEAAPTLLINTYENIQIWKLIVVTHKPSGSGWDVNKNWKQVLHAVSQIRSASMLLLTAIWCSVAMRMPSICSLAYRRCRIFCWVNLPSLLNTN